MTAADLLALRRGTDGDGYDVSDVLMAYDRPNMPAGMSGSDPIRMCSYCHRGEFNDHAPNCQNVRLSAALTAGAQAMERWEQLKAWSHSLRTWPKGGMSFDEELRQKMADLERGEP